MSEITIVVPANVIAAIKLFAATKDSRRYLNGVNLEIGATESLLVATTGAILGCFRVKSEQPGITAPIRNIIIPTDLFKHVKPKGLVEISISLSETRAHTVAVKYLGLSMTGKALDYTFPDFRRVIPSKVTGEPAQFDPALVGILIKAHSALHGTSRLTRVGIGFNGQQGALISLGDDDFVGVLMPLRGDSVIVPETPPGWLADSQRDSIDPAL